MRLRSGYRQLTLSAKEMIWPVMVLCGGEQSARSHGMSAAPNPCEEELMEATRRFPGRGRFPALGRMGSSLPRWTSWSSQRKALHGRRSRDSPWHSSCTRASDWSKLQIAGIRATLERYDADLMEVVECGFRPERQVEALTGFSSWSRTPSSASRWASRRLPMHTAGSAQADIKLVLMDNAPIGHGRAQGLRLRDLCRQLWQRGGSRGGARMAHPQRTGRCRLGYDVDFYVTNERELGFRKWVREYRPDVTITRTEFEQPEDAGSAVRDLVMPAHDVSMRCSSSGTSLRCWPPRPCARMDRSIPMSTVDLGNRVALEIARDSMIKGCWSSVALRPGCR